MKRLYEGELTHSTIFVLERDVLYRCDVEIKRSLNRRQWDALYIQSLPNEKEN